MLFGVVSQRLAVCMPLPLSVPISPITLLRRIIPQRSALLEAPFYFQMIVLSLITGLAFAIGMQWCSPMEDVTSFRLASRTASLNIVRRRK